jgi:hypothetical protein
MALHFTGPVIIVNGHEFVALRTLELLISLELIFELHSEIRPVAPDDTVQACVGSANWVTCTRLSDKAHPEKDKAGEHMHIVELDRRKTKFK